MIEFETALTADVRASLAADGVRLLSPLGGGAYFANLEDGLNIGRVIRTAAVQNVRPIQSAWKIDPMFAAGDFPAYSVVSDHSDSDDSITPQNPVVGAYVMLHEDVAQDADLYEIVESYGATVQDVTHSVNMLVVAIPFANIAALASEDAVQWIEPPISLDELGLGAASAVRNDSNRAITQADIVQGSPYNLDGSGVTAFVFDGGAARSTHTFFGGRLTTIDSDGISSHATHVSGTVGGRAPGWRRWRWM